MAEILRHSDTCTVKAVSKGMTTEAVVTSFEEKKSLHVIVNKSVKIAFVWNGSCYEGRSTGLDFETDGPEVSRIRTGRY